VIADARNATLVDCGIWTGEADGRGTRALEDGLKACGFSLAQVGRLIITHAHIDHYGIAGEVARQSGADVGWAGSPAGQRPVRLGPGARDDHRGRRAGGRGRRRVPGRGVAGGRRDR
jgi:glyoxylase-like metal-dependent hydrolase (beta-lactamase superfamily II)